MDEGKQRIAIAKEEGWRNIHWHKGNLWGMGKDRRGSYTPMHVRDYLKDLNTCHEFEKGLTDEQYELSYRDHLVKVLFRDSESGYYTLRDYLSATAAQRCEAFLKTIGKWEEGG